jgi:glycerol-3-phosphate dehydrogenase (NAD(P)+)
VGQVAVMGSGSWGTAFAAMSVDAGERVRLWARRAEVAAEINEQHTNAGYLPDITLPEGLTATDDPAAALSDAEVVVLAVPSVGIGEQLGAWGAHIPLRRPW